MNIESFFSRGDVESICKNVEDRKDFCVKKDAREGKTLVSVDVRGEHINKELAESTWSGNDYLVCFNSVCRGGKNGYEGKGNATDDYSYFMDYASFKDWFDGKMCWLDGYEVETFGQSSFW